MQETLLQATIYLIAMLVAVPISVRFGLGSVLGYLLAGIAIGPVLGLVGGYETENLQHYAEFGVVLMLFLIGLELEPHALWDMRRRLIGLGGSQVALSVGILAGAATLLGYSGPLSLAIGITFALSSTAIVLTTLTEKNLLQSEGGRSSFSVLLTQDIAVIPALAVLPLLATGSSMRFGADGSIQRAEEETHSLSLVEELPAWGVTAVTLGAVIAVILAGRYLTPVLFQVIHRTRLRELYTAMSLAVVVGIAVLMLLVGLSPALGAFVAGVVLANSEFRHEIEANIEPFKGLLLGLFFITVGAGIHFSTFLDAPLTILGLTLGTMALKGLVLYVIARIAGITGRDRWLFALGLAQAGEFGFVLVAFGVQQSVFPPHIAEQMLLVVALSMLLTPLSFILFDRLSARLGTQQSDDDAHDEIDEDDARIIIAGIGRFGQAVNRMVRAAGFRTVVLDANLDVIRLMRRFGLKSFFGDPTRPELLKAAGLDQAAVLVVAVDDRASALKLVRYAKSQRPELSVVARAHDLLHVYELYDAGADHIVRELFDSSLRAARYVLEDMGLSDYEAHQTEIAFYRSDRQNLRALAEVWKPGQPVTENDDYMRLTREMTDNLESALATHLSALEAEGMSPTSRARGDASALSGLARDRNTRKRGPRRPGGTADQAPSAKED